MKILLKKLILINFKGIRSLEVEFNHTTNIYGENAAGKTSVFDAFTWLLFGKDSTDRKDFEIKTLDENNLVISKLDHEVTGILDVDGQAVTLRRVLREKWTKKRGTDIAEFTGNETLYYWNDVPMQQSEYQGKINGILQENIFKLITNTLYFASLKWQDRRNVLMEIAGTVSDTEVFDKIATLTNKQSVFSLTNVLNSGKSFAEYKREIAARKKKLNDDLRAIPTRIDEANRSKPVVSADWNDIERQIAGYETEIADIDAVIQNSVKLLETNVQKQREKQQEIFDLEREVTNIYNTVRNTLELKERDRNTEIDTGRKKIADAQSSIKLLNSEIIDLQQSISKCEQDRNALRDKWFKVNEKEIEFDAHAFECPTCKRELDESDVMSKREEMITNFNKHKAGELDSIAAEGSRIKKVQEEKEVVLFNKNKALASVEQALTAFQQEFETLQAGYSNEAPLQQRVEAELSFDARYNQLKSEIAQKKEALNTALPVVDNTELNESKRQLRASIDELKKTLSNREVIANIDARINNLQKEERTLSQQIAELEGDEYTLEQYSKAKIDILESRINGRFKNVSFKLFETQINGGEVECCEVLINGVPFSDANNAAKINAGLDIINTLCQHYQVYAPIFIDNRESVNQLIPCESQLINLIVSADKILKVA